ncbi:MAG: hypothetical protein LWX83_17400 [Anaerolineae bacterium]|nr:hypothetical protein [Anaerolineae bacterium]
MADYPWEKLLDAERTKIESKVKIGRPVGRPALTVPTVQMHLEVSVEIKKLIEDLLEKLKNIQSVSKSRLVAFALYSLADTLAQFDAEELAQVHSFYDLRQKIEDKNTRKTSTRKKSA